MFNKGDKVIIKNSNIKSVITLVEDSPTSLVNRRVYYLKGYSNLYFGEESLEIDKQEVRNDKLNLIFNKMIKYGDSRTYSHKLDDDKLKWLVSKTNRSIAQTQFLFNLVDGNFSKLKSLEEKIKNTFYSGCPSTVDEIECIMSMDNISNSFTLRTL